MTHFIEVFPKTVKIIAVLDRTQEAGAVAEPHATIRGKIFDASLLSGVPLMNSKRIPDPNALSRAHYMHLLGSWKTL